MHAPHIPDLGLSKTTTIFPWFLIFPGPGGQQMASGTYRIGWIGKTLFKKKLAEGLARIEKHMKEEGENLKHILELEKGE